MILRNVTKRYGEKIVLNDVSVDFVEGKITAVLGESGAGKSTLLSIIAGLTPFTGTIDGVEGKETKRRQNCAYLFQNVCLLPNLTVAGNLKFTLPKPLWDGIIPAIERVGLKGKQNCYPAQLSGGERQRVAIARALSCPHDILLMDEPFSSLDIGLKKTLISLVTELWQERGDTVVFVTHDVHEAALLACRAIVLSGGTIVADVPIDRPFPRDFLSHIPEEEILMRALVK